MLFYVILSRIIVVRTDCVDTIARMLIKSMIHSKIDVLGLDEINRFRIAI